MRGKGPLLGGGIAVAIIVSLAAFGVHELRARQAARDARNAAAAALKKEDVSVTVIEGKRREEVAALMEAKGICKAADFMAASGGKEGRLFPDTYRFFPGTPATEVVAEMEANFTRKAGSPTEDQLILASIVEREAVNDADRPTIAGIYANRIAAGMRLEADPTVQYAKDSLAYAAAGSPVGFKFWQPIVQADYQGVISPFNMYLNDGLPPAPIDSPGASSIVAAISPEKNEYYYLYYRGDQILPATTYAEHLRHIAGK